MKQKYTAFFVFLTMFTVASAQQDPKKTHFMFDMQSYNPAFSGSKPSMLCISSLYHQQWYGFTDNDNGLHTGPGTQLVSVNGRVPYSKKGLGLTMSNDGLGYERTQAFQASFAYHFDVGRSSQLGVGAGAGMLQKTLDGTKYKPINPNDPLIPLHRVSDMQPDFSAGLLYVNSSFYNLYAGLSATHLLPGKLTYQVKSGEFTTYNLRTTGYFTAGASFPTMGGLLSIDPSVLVKTDATQTQFDVNLGMWYNRTLRAAAAASFKDGMSVTAMLGYKISSSLFVSYSFDVVTTKLYNISPGTHEIFINYCFIFKEGGMYLTPRFLGKTLNKN